jgi:hypothetical protein
MDRNMLDISAANVIYFKRTHCLCTVSENQN